MITATAEARLPVENRTNKRIPAETSANVSEKHASPFLPAARRMPTMD